MSRPAKDEEREERIHTEVVVDAYGSEERALGWYTYLSDTLEFPFPARCVTIRRTSPLEIGENVKVVGMASDEECMHEMLVLISWKRRTLAVPLSQLEGIDLEEETQQAIDDWHYWVQQGYEF
jgi:Calcium binding